MSTFHCSPSDIHPRITYNDAQAAIDWLCAAIGFTKRFVVPGPDGRIEPSELSLGTGVVMVGSPKPELGHLSHVGMTGVCQALNVYDDDPDDHHGIAVAAGARVIRELRTESYGARGYEALDPENHGWYSCNYRAGSYWET